MALSMPAPNGRISTISKTKTDTKADASDPDPENTIMVQYDPSTYSVTVDPDAVPVNSTICFKTNGGKIKVVFLSPFGDETATLLDSESRQVTKGGCYHFDCYFTPDGGSEFKSQMGGVVDVQPHRP